MKIHPDHAAKAQRKNDAAHDVVLVQRFKEGDESAFTAIVERHYSRIRALVNQTLHNEGDAEEVTQDAFIRVHRGLHDFRGDCRLASWLYRIAINLARNRYWFYFRRHRQNTFSLEQTMPEGGNASLGSMLSDGNAAPLSESLTNEFLSLVARSMEQLDESHREILAMRNTLDLSYKEIAANLGISIGTVKSRIARARERLRDMLHQMAPEIGGGRPPADFFETNRPFPMDA